MKYPYLSVFRFLLFIVLLPFALPVAATELPDSLLTIDYVYEYTFSDPEKAYRIVDLMRERKLDEEFRIDIVAGDLVYNQKQYARAYELYARALNSDSVRANVTLYMELLHRIITCYDIDNVEKSAEYVKLLLDKAEETGNRAMKSIALFNMGKMLYYQAEKARGYQLIKEGIEEMKQSDYRNKYYNLRYHYNTLLTMQLRDSLFQDALETLDRLESVVTATTADETTMGGLNEKEMRTLLARRVVALAALDRMDEAEEVYRQWKVTGTGYTKEDFLIIYFLQRSRRFDEVIEIERARERFYYMQNDTINYFMKDVKRELGRAYAGKNDYKNAAIAYKSLAVITDSLKVREQRSAALELAAVYETHQKEVKLQEQEVHIKVRNLLLVSAAVVILLLAILLWRTVNYTRTIRYKNKRMAGTIEDLLRQKDELFKVKNELGLLKEKEKGVPAAEEEAVIPEDKILFETLDTIVTGEKLYLKPDLSREELMKLIGVNKNRFAQILQQYAGTNTTTYVNNKRLEYAVRQLHIHPEYTIAAIAEGCGIPNVPTFNRLFKSKYGMTPTEFRSSL